MERSAEDAAAAPGGEELAAPGGVGGAVVVEAEASAAETLAAFVSWASALFYYFEEGQNPGVNDYWDAFHYVATSLSVGYANIFPCTAAGKVIGSVVMMVGPALSARALEPAGAAVAAAAPSATDAAMPELMGKLDAILQELKQLNAR